ncbi:MAG: Nif3-like dinuclear metal center hexameric protein [Chitinophagaceae bacterium]|nr:MAG: Nif3-like dinuclear metal center hexameric protein [Chitinophagaceae bacterium]
MSVKVSRIIEVLEQLAPPALQESYDNAGLLTGNPDQECIGVLCTLDCTEEVLEEAVAKGCNMVVAHHPIIFSGLKKITGSNYVQRTVISAIRKDLAIYAIHTNLDHKLDGVNDRIADRIGLTGRRILDPRPGTLKKLVCFVPVDFAGAVRDAMFAAGAGGISNYDECSFNTPGTGTFRALEGADPFTGRIGSRHEEPETRIEAVFPSPFENRIVKAMRAAHPYEEVAFDILPLANPHPGIGAGLVGELAPALGEKEFLGLLKEAFGTGIIRHSPLRGVPVQRVAVCGGAGSFLISKALAAGVDFFVTADMKYHEFFDADGRMVIADIGHFESEQYTSALLQEVLVKKFTTFAVLKSEVNTNPVRYFH